jgi:hypothetical protein
MIDKNILNDFSDDDTINMFLTMGLDTIKDGLKNIKNTNDYKIIYFHCHKMKGLGGIGFTNIYEINKHICSEINNNEYSNIKKHIVDLETEYNLLKQRLDNET